MKVALLAVGKAKELREILSRAGWRVIEARTTDGIQEALPKVSMVILEEEAVEEGGLSLEGLREALSRGKVLVVAPQDFLSSPEAAMERALKVKKAKVPFFPTRLKVGFTSLSGGTGCTTLALRFARTCAQFVPTALLETPWGEGALRAWLGLPEDVPDLYQVALGLKEPHKDGGLTVIPATRATQRLLLGNPDKLKELLDKLGKEHVVVVVDGHYAHPLFQNVVPQLDLVLAIADTRPEAIANAEIVANETKGVIVVNKAGLVEKIAMRLAGKRALFISMGERDIGGKIASFIYGGRK